MAHDWAVTAQYQLTGQVYSLGSHGLPTSDRTHQQQWKVVGRTSSGSSDNISSRNVQCCLSAPNLYNTVSTHNVPVKTYNLQQVWGCPEVTYSRSGVPEVTDTRSVGAQKYILVNSFVNTKSHGPTTHCQSIKTNHD